MATILDLPSEIIEHIISFCKYEEVSKNRLVCRSFDKICMQVLNVGFYKADKFHALCQREVKAQLPRRESERRTHRLCRHVDILAAIETRLSLLGMTFTKYMDMGLCCFIPGKVVDEIFRVLNFIKVTENPPRAHELLQELRDISSMAMEHFDEKIVGILKKKMPQIHIQQISLSQPSTPEPTAGVSITKVALYSSARKQMILPGVKKLWFNLNQLIKLSPGPSGLQAQGVSSSLGLPSTRIPSFRQDVMKLQHQLRVCSANLLSSRKDIQDCKNKLTEQRKKNLEQEQKIVQQNKLINDQNNRITEQDTKIMDLSKKVLEYDQKFVDLMTEITKVRDSHSKLEQTPSASTSGRIVLPSGDRDDNGNRNERMARSQLEDTERQPVRKGRSRKRKIEDVPCSNTGQKKTRGSRK